jgi:hypothetical protein
MCYTVTMGIMEFKSERAANRAGYFVFDPEENRDNPRATSIRVRTRTAGGWAIALAKLP